jgi:hypothetical protein
VVAAVVHVVSCLERHMLSAHGWPPIEGITKVGQWGAIAHAGLTLVAGGIVGLYQWKDGRRNSVSGHYNLRAPSAQAGVVRILSMTCFMFAI